MKSTQKLIIKVVMVVFLVAYLGYLYASDSARNVPVETIAARMESIPSVSELQKRGRADLKRYYSIEDPDTDGYVFYKAVSPMSVNELLIVKSPDKNTANRFLECVEAHLESQENVFGAYGTDQMALLSDASVGSKGNYVYYICGPDSPAWYKEFMNLI